MFLFLCFNLYFKCRAELVFGLLKLQHEVINNRILWLIGFVTICVCLVIGVFRHNMV